MQLNAFLTSGRDGEERLVSRPDIKWKEPSGYRHRTEKNFFNYGNLCYTRYETVRFSSPKYNHTHRQLLHNNSARNWKCLILPMAFIEQYYNGIQY